MCSKRKARFVDKADKYRRVCGVFALYLDIDFFTGAVGRFVCDNGKLHFLILLVVINNGGIACENVRFTVKNDCVQMCTEHVLLAKGKGIGACMNDIGHGFLAIVEGDECICALCCVIAKLQRCMHRIA